VKIPSSSDARSTRPPSKSTISFGMTGEAMPTTSQSRRSVTKTKRAGDFRSTTLSSR
jgi:hypothetical protein